jgi:hypothetical protein
MSHNHNDNVSVNENHPGLDKPVWGAVAIGEVIN